MPCRLLRAFAIAAVFLTAFAAVCFVRQDVSRAEEDLAKPTLPPKYILDYPVAGRFCPPVPGFFDEVTRNFDVVRGRRVPHHPNGGYGLPRDEEGEDKPLLHLGADVGWHRAGAPVYAVAAGVVRASAGPPTPSDKSRSSDTPVATKKSDANPWPNTQGWGNYIILEHRLPRGEYVTTLYAHLGRDRLVAMGDLVEAGQQIGMIGAKDDQINGGYDPHLHFGVRKGRLAEPGCLLTEIRYGGESIPVKLAAVGEDRIELEFPTGARPRWLQFADQRFVVTVANGKRYTSASLLWLLGTRPDFKITGYGESKAGWHDPVAFLRRLEADRRPAPFRRGKPAPSPKD